MISCYFLKEVIKLRVDLRPFFRNLRLTNKSGKTILRRWTLKMAFLGDEKSLIYELILALVSLCLLVNPIKKEEPQRKMSIDFFDYFT